MRDVFWIIVNLAISPIMFVFHALHLLFLSAYIGVRSILWDLHLVKDIEPGRPDATIIQNGKVVRRNPVGAILTIVILIVTLCLVFRWF